MTVLYVSDDNYAHLLGISLTSLFINNKDESALCILIIDDNIGDENKAKLRKTAKKYGRSLKFIKANVIIPVKNYGEWPVNIFYRLFFVSILDGMLRDERIIYLDCDTVVNDSLKPLNEIPFNGCVCAAVYECMGKYHKKNCGLSDDKPYFNSGVLVINVNEWKKKDMESKFSQILAVNADTKMEYPDEGIINVLLKDKILPISPRYNLTTIKCIFSFKELKVYRKSKFMYSEEEYKEANKKPCIVHYTNNFLVTRPWMKGTGNKHPFYTLFQEYMAKSEWSDVLIKDEKVHIQKKMVRALFGINHMLCVRITGFIYSYIKPLKYDKIIE